MHRRRRRRRRRPLDDLCMYLLLVLKNEHGIM